MQHTWDQAAPSIQATRHCSPAWGGWTGNVPGYPGSGGGRQRRPCTPTQPCGRSKTVNCPGCPRACTKPPTAGMPWRAPLPPGHQGPLPGQSTPRCRSTHHRSGCVRVRAGCQQLLDKLQAAVRRSDEQRRRAPLPVTSNETVPAGGRHKAEAYLRGCVSQVEAVKHSSSGLRQRRSFRLAAAFPVLPHPTALPCT